MKIIGLMFYGTLALASCNKQVRQDTPINDVTATSSLLEDTLKMVKQPSIPDIEERIMLSSDACYFGNGPEKAYGCQALTELLVYKANEKTELMTKINRLRNSMHLPIENVTSDIAEYMIPAFEGLIDGHCTQQRQKILSEISEIIVEKKLLVYGAIDYLARTQNLYTENNLQAHNQLLRQTVNRLETTLAYVNDAQRIMNGMELLWSNDICVERQDSPK